SSLKNSPEIPVDRRGLFKRRCKFVPGHLNYSSIRDGPAVVVAALRGFRARAAGRLLPAVLLSVGSKTFCSTPRQAAEGCCRKVGRVRLIAGYFPTRCGRSRL